MYVVGVIKLLMQVMNALKGCITLNEKRGFKRCFTPLFDPFTIPCNILQVRNGSTKSITIIPGTNGCNKGKVYTFAW